MNIIQRLIPVSNTATRPGLALVPKFITIHETDNTGTGADAAAHARLQQRGNDRAASWHLQIDDHEIIQSIPFDEVAWAAGDGRNGPGNRTSIHIEMCVNADANYEQMVSKTVEVVQYLMSRYSISIDHIVPHKHWTGKNCPRNLLPRWDGFIKRCQGLGTKDGWVQNDAQWFFYKNSSKQTGWVKVKSKWYFLDANGVMQTGWVKDENKWYFLDSNGVMQSGWVKVKDKWYYLARDGAMVTGWVKYKSKWYFLKENGEMAIGWIKDKDKWYYLDPDGSMVSGKQTISGKAYTFGKDGALIEEEVPAAGGYTGDDSGGNGEGDPPAGDTSGKGDGSSTGGDNTPSDGENTSNNQDGPAS
ncbi:N-acetylmuramoyl-L-alanine amidase [Neobacillus novalis]|uniref:N-acetylmuramoyl-L-alanine amidase n=1 Tax=Neobacillus novalis TaxID=220687 RepID=A0AA95MKE5_9BACI|nr:N-acetylmuramoyl-L-alanine amidase [Neobacillus novalis]WHY85519.1 N-acetylmuramoyl-L-alanine amidase [Neobacillus novalis]